MAFAGKSMANQTLHMYFPMRFPRLEDNTQQKRVREISIDIEIWRQTIYL